MRDLIILRGCPGSGKSTALEESGLKNFSLSSDTIRLMLRAPELTTDGKFQVSQMDNTLVFELLDKMLENRMKNGSPTIVDATHCSSQKWHSNQMNRYRELAKKYKYRLYYWEPEMEDISIYIERNKNRKELDQVPEKVIQKMYDNWNNVSMHRDFTKLNKIEFRNDLNGFNEDLTEQYKNVIVVGDVHGCYQPLKELTDKYDIEDESNLFIFVGDYFDRGIQNLETLDFLFNIYQKKNVVLLEGNHESHWKDWAFGEKREDSGMFRFVNTTLKEWQTKYKSENELKKKLRDLHRKLIPACYFKFNNKKYLITHAGLACIPRQHMAACQYISGHGGYEYNVTEKFQNSIKKSNQDIIQIFGHRSALTSDNSISLEGQIEFGGYLKCFVINKDSFELIKIKNDVYDANSLETDQKLKKIFNGKLIETEDQDINAIANSRYIRVKKLPNNIMSLNFTQDVFYNAIWNSITIKARGLFVDQFSGKVVARSYDKFFNFGQQGEREEELENLVYPVRVSKKENGFLGILSWDLRTESFIFATKSTTGGDCVPLFKDIWKDVAPETKEKLESILKKEKMSALFEVCHPEDVHIIDYKKEKRLFLLDFVKNELHFSGEDFISTSKHFLQMFKDLMKKETDKHLEIIEHFCVNSKEEFLNKIEKYLIDSNIEGFVCTDAKGKMYKEKSESYLTWKRRRRIFELLLDEREIPYILDEDIKYIEFLKENNLNFNNIVEIKKVFKE